MLLDRGGQAVNLNVVFDANSDDDPLVRERLDALLAHRNKGSVETVANTIFPDALYARHLGDSAANHLYQTATGWLVLVTWPINLLVMLFAPVYLRLFGDGYTAGTSVVLVLAVFYIGLTLLADILNALLDPRLRTG